MKIFLDTIGCRLNQAEIESLARQFRQAGHEIVPSAEGADIAVINTCTVTAKAASDSRAAIRRSNRSGAQNIVVTGCWATLDVDSAAAMPAVQRIIPNSAKDKLAADLLGLPHEFFDLEPLARQTLPGSHLRTRAFIKAQDGCDNTCTFCITTIARGPSRSRTIRQVVDEGNSAIQGGTNEIVLTGVQLGSWGHDFEPPLDLADLLVNLLSQTSISRLRLSSIEPWDLEDDLLRLWSDPRLCRHLHLPLQSGSPSVLKRMARRITTGGYRERVLSARSVIPEVAITTDLITGFPGETEAEFEETMQFVKAMDFAGGHVFPFSARPGTPAARLRDPVPGERTKKQAAALRSALATSARAYRAKFVGRTMPVLWEARTSQTASGFQIEGLTDNYIRVVAVASEPRWNQLDRVRLVAEGHDHLFGEIEK